MHAQYGYFSKVRSRRAKSRCDFIGQPCDTLSWAWHTTVVILENDFSTTFRHPYHLLSYIVFEAGNIDI